MVEGPSEIYLCCNCVELALLITQNQRRRQIVELETSIKQLEFERGGRSPQ
jgi:hypothetical protein